MSLRFTNKQHDAVCVQQTANKKASSHRCCSCRWARPRPAPPALPSWPPSTSPSSSLLRPRPLPVPRARRRSPRLRPRPGRRRRCCPTACCCPPRTGGCGYRSGSAPRSLSCCSRKCCNRKCCSRRCCSRKCRKTHSRSPAACGRHHRRRRRRLSSLLRCWSRPPRSPGRRARSSSGPCGLLRPPAAGSAQTGVRWTGCVGASGGSRDRDTRGPAGRRRHFQATVALTL